jgi:hypothetical protein
LITGTNKARFDVRIPELLLGQMRNGTVTVSMLLAMTFLYRWADWKTGRVEHASAGGLRTATARAFSVRTFQSAMKRLEDMGWITRHIVNGSRQDYPVTLHNYKWVDETGEVHILNCKSLVAGKPARRLAGKDYGEPPVNAAALEDCDNSACGDACGPMCGEASDKILSLNESKNDIYRRNASSFSPENDLTDEWIQRLIHHEEEIVQSLPFGLTHFVSTLHPLTIPIPVTESAAVVAFNRVNELLLNGAARLFGTKRGSNSYLLDFQRIWDLDEVYGFGTAESLAEQVVASCDSHRAWIWGYLVDQLCDPLANQGASTVGSSPQVLNGGSMGKRASPRESAG